jgi:hypothetical protein
VLAPGDLHLKAGSPAIDKGDPNLDVTGQVDLDGYARVYNNRVDIGVDEAAPPPVPSVLHVTVLSPSQLKLTWKDNSINERGFKIERSIGVSTTFTQIATVGAGVISYTNSNLAASTKYNYRVRSYNDFGSSVDFIAASGTTSAPTSVPLAPSGLTLGPITADQIG